MELYLLDVGELMHEDAGNRLEELLLLLDETRQKKALAAGTSRARAAELGAGLLLQKAALDWEDGVLRGGEKRMRLGLDSEEPEEISMRCTVSGLCSELTEVFSRRCAGSGLQAEPPGAFPLRYRYGEKGKPYFADFSLFFSLSHSGDYVLCAVARREIGADLQRLQPVDVGKLARRFFSEPERLALERCKDDGERQRLFFELWTRKEAYGKLTGAGVATALGRDMLSADCGNFPQPVRWIPFSPPPGYAAAVCVEGREFDGL
ncbi:MAG: 4'-phosphopantetheinyl transferase superfamily protein [Roseburia sp.]|nr:4'-phosphopantetheinyl transferase superfamily protein [Roseburia sp.]MCM1098367.1 4'-phosphopantetheinyl transferase superfamily protein [Ruminococcus flavefaciens]